MNEPVLLSGRDVAALLTIGDVVDAVDCALVAQAIGTTSGPVSAKLPALGGGSSGAFHAKGACLELRGARYAAFKVNGNFPENPARHGLPTIQGLIVLSDGACGTPLAVLDSISITALRTAAASAVAARWLAPPGTRQATIVGCGVQGWAHARALRHVFPRLELLLHDLDSARAASLGERVATELRGPVAVAAALETAVRSSELVVTCTTSREPIVRSAWIRAGAFVAAVGADSPGKQELEPELLRRSRVVVDDLEACAGGGELAHAIAAGLMTRDDVAARLADVVAGRLVGRSDVRRSAEDVVVFDSTGIALEDVATAALVYERARDRGVGLRMDFVST